MSLSRSVFPICTILIIIFVLLFVIFAFSNKITIIAETNSLQMANDIEEFITDDYLATKSIRIKDGLKYKIGLLNISKDIADEKAILLADSYFFNENFTISPNVRYNSNRKKYVRNLNNSFSRKINKLAPVIDSFVEITLGKCDFEYKKCEPSRANIEIKVFYNADVKNIERIAKNLLVSGGIGLDDEHIKINFKFENDCVSNKCNSCPPSYPVSTFRYETLADEYYRIGSYEKAWQMLLEAQKRGNNCEKSLNSLDKMLELNAAIAKNPNDYKLYLKRGDLQNIDRYAMFSEFSSITSNYYAAIIDYEKALALNPHAYEIYEKLGDAYKNCGYKKCPIGCKLEKDEKDYIKAIKNYEKSLKYWGGDDVLYIKLGRIYREEIKDYQKAIEYFSKVNNLYNEPEMAEPIPTVDVFVKTGYYPIVAVELANLYAKTGNYNKALEILDKTIKNTKLNYVQQDVNNLKFLYNWRAKNYKQALKQARNCSMWYCKLISF